jgi:hypothetical protein
MDSKLKLQINNESFKEKLTKSTIFQATIEQAQILSSRTRHFREVLNIHRESSSLRSSSTFQSSIFSEDTPIRRRENSYKPKDNISSDFFGKEKNEFYRKSVVSDFKPDFQPKFSYQSTWEVDSKTFKKKDPEGENWFKPIRKVRESREGRENRIGCKRNDTRSESPLRPAGAKKEDLGYIRSTRATSKATSRPTTPSRNPIVFTEPAKSNLEESCWTTRVETEPDRYYKSILRENQINDCKNRRTDESFHGSVIEKNFWDSSKEVQEFAGNENKYEKVLQAWRNHKILCDFSGTPQEKVPSYMRKTISSLCKSKKLG